MNKLKEKQEEEIQQDLDNAKFGMICSNEDTFKRYVFEKLNNFRKETIENERKRIRRWGMDYVHKDIVKYGTDKHGIALEDLLNNLIKQNLCLEKTKERKKKKEN